MNFANLLMSNADGVATITMSNGPRALLLQKDLINRWLNLPMDEAIEAGISSLALAYMPPMSHSDRSRRFGHEEGKAKRRPNFLSFLFADFEAVAVV